MGQLLSGLSYLFNTVFFYPIQNILVGFYKLFLSFHLPGAFGWAIILLVIVVRLVLHPFLKQQIHTAKKMQELKPHLDKLTKQHKDNPKELQAQQMKLYQEHGVNPAAGCLFMLVQFPIIAALYSTLNLFLSHSGTAKALAETLKQINDHLYFPFLKIQSIDPHFFGLNLALTPQKSGLWFYYLIPLITAALQYFQAQASIPPQPVLTAEQIREKAKDVKVENASQDMQQAMNTQMKYVFPLIIGYVSFTVPVGLSLYWNIFSLFSIMQYRSAHKVVEESVKIEEAEIVKPSKKNKKK